MGGRGSNIKTSHGMRQAAALTPGQALVAKLRADPTSLLQMTDSEALTAFQEIENRPIGQGENDTFVQRYMDAIGWSDAMPTVLRPTAYNQSRRAAGAQNMYHADKDYQGTSGAAFNRQYMTGNRGYSSNGVYGAGTYWASQSASSSAGYGSHQIKGFMNQNARMITNRQLRVLAYHFKNSHPRAAAFLSGNRKVGYGGSNEILYPIVAAANGYNTILAHNDTRRGSYIVTLNRAATTVCSQTNDNAHPGMRNW